MNTKPLSWDKLLVALGVLSVITTASAAGAVIYQKVYPIAAPEPIQELQSTLTPSSSGIGNSTIPGPETGSAMTTSVTGTVSFASQNDPGAADAAPAGTATTIQFPAAPALPGRNSASVAAAPGAPVFDAVTLALHDGRDGSCFISYNGQIYDVTGNVSWVNCMHHGVQGGRDITSIFPHPVSRLTGIPIVGTYSNGTTGSPVTPPVTGDDDGDEEDDAAFENDDEDEDDDQYDDGHEEQEIEDHDEDNSEDSEESEEQEPAETSLIVRAGATRMTLVA